MGWSYKVITDLTVEDKAARRLTLDAFGIYAHLSAYVPVFAYLLYRLGSWALGRTQGKGASYEPVARSARRQNSGLAAAWRRARWWLSEPVSQTRRFGHRDEWVFGIAWTLWLLALCVKDTGTG